jgi:geranylgeranyl diphosphate synthase type II
MNSDSTSNLQNAAFLETAREERCKISNRCTELIDAMVTGPPLVKESISYCVLDGGKKLRAILCLWTHDFLNGTQRDACLDIACAVECMHAYSLIHDDLPCMDDDDFRRGKPSCHKKFGEAAAVLAGDALLTLSFEIVATIPKRWHIAGDVALDVLRLFAEAGGTGGLIGGQTLDLLAQEETTGEKEEDLRLLQLIHKYKTAKLISASMEAGAVCAEADGGKRELIREAGLMAGQAFQVIDDILDVQMDRETLGKTPGKDIQQGKLTYPSLLGVTEAKVRAGTLIEEARAMLEEIGPAPKLNAVLDFFLSRTA